jgi:hypothetical protein
MNAARFPVRVSSSREPALPKSSTLRPARVANLADFVDPVLIVEAG